jgi:hypothetical protein
MALEAFIRFRELLVAEETADDDILNDDARNGRNCFGLGISMTKVQFM